MGLDGRCFIAVASPEIGGEYFDSYQGITGPNRRHGLGEQAGPVIALIVASHSRQHHVAELECLNGFGHPLRFQRI